MRFYKVLLFGFCVLALSFGVAVAGINPADPGLPVTSLTGYYGGNTLGKNALSIMCVACHTRAPGDPQSAAPNGSHFVTDASANGYTHSGGGWTSVNSKGSRTGGEYFRINKWDFSGGGGANLGTWSKYGKVSDNVSYFTAAASDNAGVATTDTTVGDYYSMELTCESCHNITKNVAGGNNLVAPMTSAGGSNMGLQVTNYNNGTEATVCVGCHGFMYTLNASNSANTTNYADARNDNNTSGGKRDNNHRHSIAGTTYNQNHHVMTADKINPAQAAAALLWRDVTTVDVTNSGWPSGSDTMTTALPSNPPFRGTMPMVSPWTGGVTRPGTATNFTCVHCHVPHAGDDSEGASILRGTGAASTLGGRANVLTQRLGEGSSPNDRGWWTFNDSVFCYQCHTLTSGR